MRDMISYTTLATANAVSPPALSYAGETSTTSAPTTSNPSTSPNPRSTLSSSLVDQPLTSGVPVQDINVDAQEDRQLPAAAMPDYGVRNSPREAAHARSLFNHIRCGADKAQSGIGSQICCIAPRHVRVQADVDRGHRDHALGCAMAEDGAVIEVLFVRAGTGRVGGGVQRVEMRVDVGERRRAATAVAPASRRAVHGGRAA